MRKAHQGRIAVISGAASDIGQACAVRLAQEGAQIVVVDRENAKQTLDLISAVGGSATAITCDVSEPMRHSSPDRHFTSTVALRAQRKIFPTF
jgi:NAD(P)-dependent dehydrogenase (short-subunit alcohol dehydrogenase family)